MMSRLLQIKNGNHCLHEVPFLKGNAFPDFPYFFFAGFEGADDGLLPAALAGALCPILPPFLNSVKNINL